MSLNNIIESADDVRLDSACKKILENKEILSRILKEYVKEYSECDYNKIERCIETVYTAKIGVDEDTTNVTLTTIKGNNTESATITEGTVRYDVIFDAALPKSKGQKCKLIINVEAQNKSSPGYALVSRGIYYCSRLISAQKDREFTKSEYNKIQKVYSIWICFNPSARDKDSIISYSIAPTIMHGTPKPENVTAYDLANIVIINIGNRDSTNSVIRLLSRIFDEEESIEDKIAYLSSNQIHTTDRLMEGVNDMCNYSEYIFEKGQAKGRKEGVVIGREEGIIKGREEERVELLDQMHSRKIISAKEAAEILNISEKEFLKLVELRRKNKGTNTKL